MLEYDQTWTFTSTGVSEWEDAYHAVNHTFQCEISPGSSAAFRIETRRRGSTNVSLLGAVISVDESTTPIPLMISGALYQVRARVSHKTSTATAYVQAIGHS